MAKNKELFGFVKKIFNSDPKTKQEKKEKRNRWLFGKLKAKMAPPALMNSTLAKAKCLLEAEEQQSKHALAVAVATAAAAEAAIAAAKAAAEVVRITGAPSSYRYHREFAAIRIQTSFRGYLARRALRALKALVKLQALVRGRAVRRQTSITLKNLQSLIKIQSEARENRVRMSFQSCEANDRWRRELKEMKEMNLKDEGKKWDGSSLSKEEIKAICANREEAAMKRERALEYASTRQGRRNSRRHSWMITGKELEPVNLNTRWSWLETQKPWNKLHIHDNTTTITSPTRCNLNKLQQQNLRAIQDSVHLVEEDGLTRRSFNRSRRNYIRHDDSLTSSPAFPRRNYMAVTESARARSRSISTPRQTLTSTRSAYVPIP